MRRYLALALCLLMTLTLAPIASAQTRGRDPQRTTRTTQPGVLPVPPAEENENLPPGDIPYHELAPMLNDIAASSNRVQVEVTGQSAGGRDLYLATVSDPSAFGKIGRYKALRHLMISDPEAAQERAAEFTDFKVPVMMNCSIHGNEWEGVDACMELIERFAYDDDAETQAILDNAILLFNVVQNPDGRVQGTRANANGFDLNRDFITQSQPETRITARIMEEWKPMSFLDLHGYVNPMLIEPCTPPHNPNYEYDLYIDWALGQAEAMRDELNAQTGLPAEIPFLDYGEGWDDWPPIFAPMFAMYHGAYGHTLEAPARPSTNLPPATRAERAETSTRAHYASVMGALNFVADNRLDMVHDQIEVFRRGFFEEVQRSIADQFGEEHDFLADFPEAYVIPAGWGQDSELAAADLVDFLVANGVEVTRAATGFSAGGATYPAGSYVVDMAQPLRGLANTVLEQGYDISDVVDDMYDISGWSHAKLWGATVERIDDEFSVRTSPVIGEARVAGSVPGGRAGAYAFEIDSEVGIATANALLAAGAEVARTDDGLYVVRATTAVQSMLRSLAAEGVSFTALGGFPSGAEMITAPRIALAGGGDTEFVLRELGFDYDSVSTGALNGGFDLSGYDVLYVAGSGLRYGQLNATGLAEVDAFLAAGGDVVATGLYGALFNDEAGIVEVEFDFGGGSDNGIVNVVTNPSSTIATDDDDDTSFVYRPVWFTAVGDGVTVDQSYSDSDVLLSGHWQGQEEAAGAAFLVSDEVGGTRATVFGAEPTFRAHPKKLFTQVANAIYWAATD